MRINLQYFLNKNKLTLAQFCEKNSLDSYESLCEYCEKRRLLPVDLDFYNQAIPIKNTVENKTNAAKTNKTKDKKPSAPRRPRKTSKVTKKRPTSTKDNS